MEVGSLSADGAAMYLYSNESFEAMFDTQTAHRTPHATDSSYKSVRKH